MKYANIYDSTTKAIKDLRHLNTNIQFNDTEILYQLDTVLQCIRETMIGYEIALCYTDSKYHSYALFQFTFVDMYGNTIEDYDGIASGDVWWKYGEHARVDNMCYDTLSEACEALNTILNPIYIQ